MVESQSQTPLPRELCNQDLLPLIVQHLSTKQLFQTTAVSKSFQQSICVATTKPENPLRVWGRESCLSKRLPKGAPKPPSRWPVSEYSRKLEDGTKVPSLLKACHFIDRQWSSPGDLQSLGFWGKLALFVLLVARRHRPHAVRVLRWAWAESAPERYSPLLRESVRELAACLLVLLRKPEWKHCRMSWAAELDAALDGELQRLEAWDDYNANAQRIAVHQQLAANLRLPPHYAPWPVLDPKLRAVTAIPLASLTAEQQTILTTALPAEAADCRDVSMTITAFAGTGKTSTLRALTEVHQDKQFLYVAYNKEVAKQAQREFNIRHVTCLTSHSVAGSMLRDMQRHGKVLCEGTLQLRPIADILRRYNAIEAIAKYTTNTFYGFARVVRAAVENFCTSVDLAVAGSHLPDPVEWPRVRAKPDYVAWSQHVWNCMCDPRNLAIQFTHNTYLKLFVLTQPELKHPYTHRPYDVILVDEAQDLNPITFQMIDRQPCTKIYVGDPHQHIYSFNGSCDMLSRVSAAKRFTLTCSFRLGPEVAMLANRLLAKLKGETRSIVGLGPAGCRHTPPAPASPAGHAVGGDAADGSPAEGAPPSPQPSQEREVHRAVYRCMAMDVDCRAAVRRAAEAPDIDIGPAGVAMLPVDAATGRWPQLHYICRSNYGWLCAAAELVQKFPWIRLHLLVSMGKDWQTGAREPQIFGKVRDGFKLYTRSGRPNAADLKRFSDYAALKAYAKATEEPELLSIVRIIDKFKNETLAVLERVHAARISSPTSHHLHPFQRRMLRRRMLCWAPATRRRARSLTMCNWGTTSSHAPSRKTWVCQPRPSRKQLVDEHNLIYVAASRARHTLILNADLQNYLAQGMAQRLSVAKRDPELLARLACGLPNVGGPPGSPGDSPLAMCVCGICYKLAHPVQEGALDVVVGSNSSGGRLGLSLVCTECAGTSIYADLLRPPG
ncbi:hypothetical protein WJX72_000718 [[Myrmecia] bisecta]|uniref:UvrD-like helicase ATP-binding domain-containing protein n=1 Tax=[Myrmecia] bisecta TaxID=41462 RepID=A0AAW1R4I6_9CHLO